jgi:sterol desaturase/sphingolipid hydroxylase (fatty acid hydroxylase superfamily)
MNPNLKLLRLLVLLVVVACSLIEAAILAKRRSYDWKAMGVSLSDLALRRIAQTLLPLSIAGPLLAWVSAHRIHTVALDGWLVFTALFVGQEFCFYWYHRAAHRMRWFWCSHSVHHSPNELTLAAAFRIGMLGRLTGATVFYAPLLWLGFPAETVFAMLTLNLLYQFWIHATWIPKLGPLEFVLNTPSAHRVHHAANLDYLDANYGGVLCVFDRMFGTYRTERDDQPCRYGLVEPVTTYNPLRIEFHQWIGLGKDLLAARSLRAICGYLLMPPGWQPEGPGNTTEALRARVSAQATASAPVQALPQTHERA